MKIYGQKIIEIRYEDYLTSFSYSYKSATSRRAANRKKQDKRIMHKRARRIFKHDLSMY